jgi:hypothetical protein
LRVYLGDSSAWTESNLSGSNEPGKEIEIGTINTTYQSGNTYTISLDPSQIMLGGKVSLIIEMDNGGNDVWFQSSENSSKPQLLLDYMVPSNG